MESLSIGLSTSPSFLNHSKTPKSKSKSCIILSNLLTNLSFSSKPIVHSCNSLQVNAPVEQRIIPTTQFSDIFPKIVSFLNPDQFLLKSSFCLLFLGPFCPLSCLAAENTPPVEDVPGKINIEAILVSIDDFFNRYPFFVATVTFIWLVAIPLTEEYLQKYKFISAFNAFKKLQDDPDCQLLDIRDKKSIAYLGSPNLKVLNKSVVQVEFYEGDEDGFLKRVLEKFGEPANTSICIVDNFDGNSMKVAELLVKNGFKEAYAIRGGIRGNKGWQEIQETLLPPSVRVYPRKKVKVSKQLGTNGDVKQPEKNTSSNTTSSQETDNGNIGYKNATSQSKGHRQSLSPYPNYSDFKPPSSPTPSKPTSD